MKFGFYLPTRGHTATREALETLVAHGEALGFHSVMIADHVVFPTEVHSKYPYTVSGEFPGHGDALEQLTLMAFLAGITKRLRLVASVIKPAANCLCVGRSRAAQVSYRPPYHTRLQRP
jgi:alkanesulfonate monooxygenase SsuD/methylene tetrahydromethanopterin reductase-like flavin-dependent oxidoreductase (luciferase family)